MNTLLTDFDGTLTERDFYHLVLDQDPGAAQLWQRYVNGTLTHFAALQELFGRLKGTAAQWRARLPGMGFDPGAPAQFERLHAAGWRIEIVSAGCRWYIEELLGPALRWVELHANPGVFEDGAGLRMSLPTADPYFDAATGISKKRAVLAALARGGTTVFIGDGPPDLPAALRLPPECRFARGWLAEELTRRSEPFRPYTRWSCAAAELNTP